MRASRKGGVGLLWFLEPSNDKLAALLAAVMWLALIIHNILKIFMPIRDIISRELLERLRDCPKRVTGWICQDREKPSHTESTCEAVSDAGDDFLIYLRQSNILTDDFSCGIKWKTSDGEWIVLARYNGSSHVHTNRIDGEVFVQQCHVHHITVEAVQRGWSHENYAIATDLYSTLSEAKCLLAKEFNVHDLVPESSQLLLWN